MGDTWLPGDVLQRAQVRHRHDVGETGGDAALDVDDVAHRRGAVDRAAERDAVPDGPGEPTRQDVAATLGSDDVAVAEAHDVDAVVGEVGLGCLHRCGIHVDHGSLLVVRTAPCSPAATVRRLLMLLHAFR